MLEHSGILVSKIAGQVQVSLASSGLFEDKIHVLYERKPHDRCLLSHWTETLGVERRRLR